MLNNQNIIVESGLVNVNNLTLENETVKNSKIIQDAEQLKGKKVLYFEGVGWDFHEEENFKNSDVGNFRIRTSFLNNDGEQIYLEMGNTRQYEKKGKKVERYGLWIDFCFKVPEKGEETKYHEIYKRSKEHLQTKEIDYTKENITNWINNRLNCDFDTIHVLDRFYGYHVHGEYVDGQSTYNLMENVELNHLRALKRKIAYERIDMYYREVLNEKYSKIGLNEMNENGIEIHCSTYEKDIVRTGLPRKQFIEIA